MNIKITMLWYRCFFNEMKTFVSIAQFVFEFNQNTTMFLSLLVLVIPITQAYDYYDYDYSDYMDYYYHDYFFDYKDWMQCEGTLCASKEVYVHFEHLIPVPDSDLVQVKDTYTSVTLESSIKTCAPLLTVKVLTNHN